MSNKISHAEFSVQNITGELNKLDSVPGYHLINVHLIDSTGHKYSPLSFRLYENMNLHSFYEKMDAVRGDIINTSAKNSVNNLKAVIEKRLPVQSFEIGEVKHIKSKNELSFTDSLILKAENCNRAKNHHSALFKQFQDLQSIDKSYSQNINSIRNDIAFLKSEKAQLINGLRDIYIEPAEAFNNIEQNLTVQKLNTLIKKPEAFGELKLNLSAPKKLHQLHKEKLLTYKEVQRIIKENSPWKNRQKILNERLQGLSKSFHDFHKVKEFSLLDLETTNTKIIKTDDLLIKLDKHLTVLKKEKPKINLPDKHSKLVASKKEWIRSKKELRTLLSSHYSLAKTKPLEKVLKTKGISSAIGSSFGPASKIIQQGLSAVKKVMELSSPSLER